MPNASICAIIGAMSLVLPVLLAAASTLSGGSVRISSDRTYYDRKGGFACFTGKVSVEDPEYQLHADRAFVYMGETNDLQRIVALGNVAITNGTKRAYGAKATYQRENGVVILRAGEGGAAEVREADPDGDRVVRGKTIKFWTGSQQVEVLEAEISAPSKGSLDSVKEMLGR